MDERPSILITGATGFIGKYLLEALSNEFTIFGVARRTPAAAGIRLHPNTHWIPADVSDEASLARVIDRVNQQGGADYVLHLAGYYDFSGHDHPAYRLTNVDGTRHMLAQARRLKKLKRFIFASSLTVSEFPHGGVRLNEESPCDAEFPYAWSKRLGEEAVKEHSEYFPCTIFRAAAVFSDWCEYAPLYQFLTTWLSKGLRSRIIGGRGESAIPYLHVQDMVAFIRQILKLTQRLPRFGTYVASVDECTSHLSIYRIANRYFRGQVLAPRHVPRLMALLGVVLMNVLYRAVGKRPFEQPWMMKYIDRQMPVDASATRQMLRWTPVPRYHINRRLLFMIENMKRDRFRWMTLNEEANRERGAERPNFRIYTCMMGHQHSIVEAIFHKMVSPEYSEYFVTYQQLGAKKLHNRIEVLCQMLEVAVRLGDRTHLLSYAHSLAKERYLEGFYPDEVIYAVRCTGQITVEHLISSPEMKGLEERIYDTVMMTIQLVTDEIEDTFEKLARLSSEDE